MWELVLTRANETYYEHTTTNKPLLQHIRHCLYFPNICFVQPYVAHC